MTLIAWTAGNEMSLKTSVSSQMFDKLISLHSSVTNSEITSFGTPLKLS